MVCIQEASFSVWNEGVRTTLCFWLLLSCVAALVLPSASATMIPILRTDDLLVPQGAIILLNVSDYDGHVHSVLSVAHKSPFILRLRQDGVVVSSNPVWNVCVSGAPIRLGLIRHNRDTYHHRRGHMHRDIPLTCRDYHRGDTSVWKHPDFPELELTLDARGHVVAGIPSGFIAVRDQASLVADQ